MGDRAGDSFRGWVYALGLCQGVGCVGSLLRLALFDVLVDVFLGGMGCWIVGVQWGWGVCFGFGNELFGAAYHLRDECHILNIFGMTVWGE